MQAAGQCTRPVIGNFADSKSFPFFLFFVMDGIIGQLGSQAVWEEFLAHRLLKGRFTWNLFEDADSYVEKEEYRSVVETLLRGEGPGIPERRLINKMGTSLFSRRRATPRSIRS